jgi:peptidoglycan/LPS O-acetylase OafA/YrhL
MVIYLKGLNGIRAIAAMAVVFAHINSGIYGFKHEGLLRFDLAPYGVTIFFSLSGFLITYLLLVEKRRTEVSISKFYIRRILRIRPLYFLVIGIALLIKEPEPNSHLVYYLFFLPNVPLIYGGNILLIVHYWSLGVEEQFYLFWPWCIKYFRNVLVFLIFFVILSILLKLIFKYQFGGWSINYAFLYTIRYDCMALGGIGAWIALYKNRFLNEWYFRYLVILSWITLGFVAFNYFHLISMIDHEIIAFATAILILDQAFGSQVIFDLEKPFLTYIGNISFGIYMYHPLIIFVLASAFGDLYFSPTLNFLIRNISVFLTTIFVSHISYVYFEKPILSLKDKFSTIGSAN